MTLITLTPGCTAEHDTCGSCKFFRRDREYDSTYGQCGFVMPKKIAVQWDIRRVDPAQKNAEYTGNEDRQKDTDRCDLHRPDGKRYIVQRIVGEWKVQ